MTDSETITVEPGGVRQRLDRYLASLKRWGSRASVQRLIEAGHVSVEGQRAVSDQILKVGQSITIAAHASVAPTCTATGEDIPLTILFEDPWLIVVNKPAGLVVHPATGNWRGTLVNALVHHWGDALRPGLDQLRPGIVHRLDKDTSGVLVVAKDIDTQGRLTDQFRNRQVKKEYYAFVWGTPAARSGVIDQPIARHPVERKRMAIREGGRVAVSRYEVIESGPRMSLLRVAPETGRTHQIRVHLASIGHPIVGDRVYGRGRASPGLARQALHARALTFVHPTSAAPMHFEAPLPADLEALKGAIQQS